MFSTEFLSCSCWRSGPHLRFEDEVSAVQLQVDKLQTLGVNKIIALGHSGFTVDKEIAKKVRGVDVVIGGHSNTFLFTGTEVNTAVSITSVISSFPAPMSVSEVILW